MRAVASEVEKERAIAWRKFSTTRWSVIIDGAGNQPDEQKARDALTHLCRTYWRPTFSFISRRSRSVEDAKDLTQEFFAMIVQTNWLRHAAKQRGRFRSLLLQSLVNFLRDQSDKRQTRKRGGNVEFISWDDWVTEAPSHLTISAQTLDTISADRLFDLRWAATVVEQALLRLGEECELKGRRRLFDALSCYLVNESGNLSYQRLSARLQIPENLLRRQLHNMRLRYRWLLRDEVARTVDDMADVDDEIRHLCKALGTQAG